jgi:hypothetical protein
MVQAEIDVLPVAELVEEIPLGHAVQEVPVKEDEL